MGLSVTFVHCVKTAKHILELSSPYDSSVSLGMPHLVKIVEGDHPIQWHKTGGVGQKCNFQPFDRHISETAQDKSHY